MKKGIVWIVISAMLLGGCAKNQEVRPSQGLAVEQTALTLGENTIPQLVSKISSSVVGLAVTVDVSGQSVQGLGTGFFVDEAGYILTNHHVAGDASDIQVFFADGSHRSAQKIWSDAALDLAILRCDGEGPFVPLELGALEDVQVGQTVVAVGTPLDLAFQQTVTSGIVSGLNRTLPVQEGASFLEELIQTDASINPGNSGGPLVTLNGRVIGINTVKVVDAEGLGFAIPADLAQPIVEHVVQEGSFVPPYAGMTVLDQDLARYYGREMQKGLTVLAVDPRGPAAKAGIQAGDVLLQAEGKDLTTVLSFRKSLYRHQPGDEISVTWERNGKTVRGNLTLGRQ